jgi:glycosyltransferase involved in cell wall biosynthesis
MASAVDLYPEFRCKADSVGIGANMENVPENGPVRSYTPGSNLELILIGKSFVRKGGLVAIEACRLLRRRRIPAVIHIVGDFPEDIRIRLRHTENSDWVMYHGWIDKNETAGMQKMAALLSRSHIHLLPTQGDLSPHVICEANAFGVPTVARRVGGIPDLVKEGQSGELVADADPLKYAEAITQVLKDYSRYSANARAVYEREQRWSVVADAICRKITYHLHKTAHLSSYLGGN